MKRRVTILLCCLWLIAIAALLRFSGGSLIDQVPQFMLLSNSIESGSQFIGLDSDSESLYGLLALKTEEGKEQTYRIVELSESGQAIAATPVIELTLEEESAVSDFAVTSQGFYLTTVSETKQSASLFFIEVENLTEENLPGSEDESDSVTLRAQQSLTAQSGRQINWAGYEDGAFVSWKDDGTGAEYYAADAAQDAACDQLLLEAGQEANNQQFYLICNLALLLGGVAAIWLIVKALYHRSYTVYMTVLTETLLFLLVFSCAILMARERRDLALEENEKFSSYYIELLWESLDENSLQELNTEEFYSQESYYDLWNLLSEFVSDDRSEGLFEDVCLVSGEDQLILVSSSGQNGLSLSDIYGDNLERIELGYATEEELSCSLAAVRTQAAKGLFTDAKSRSYLLYALVIFLVSGLICLWLLLGQGRELAGLLSAMLTASSGQEVPSKGRAKSTDVALMWNSFMELQKQISSSNYVRYRIYESCYRFAPKNIEKIFGKDSITEVVGGDTIRLTGTVAFITSDEAEHADEATAMRMSSFISRIEKHQKESDAFFVPGSCDLTSLEVLFLEKNSRSVDFGISLLDDYYSSPETGDARVGILLYYSDFLYAVAGNEDQCFPFLLSEEKEKLERLAEWFRKLELRLVITGEVKEREAPGGSCRYLGYFTLEKVEKRLELYEVLNACTPAQRRLKIDTEEKFQKAIQLFYQHDFYLARNGFSDVLKANPLDQMSKWYLFTCEKYLNQSYSDGDICRLRPEE